MKKLLFTSVALIFSLTCARELQASSKSNGNHNHGLSSTGSRSISKSTQGHVQNQASSKPIVNKGTNSTSLSSKTTPSVIKKAGISNNLSQGLATKAGQQGTKNSGLSGNLNKGTGTKTGLQGVKNSGTVNNSSSQISKNPQVVKTPTKIKIPQANANKLAGNQKSGTNKTAGNITSSKQGQPTGNSSVNTSGKINIGKIPANPTNAKGPLNGKGPNTNVNNTSIKNTNIKNTNIKNTNINNTNVSNTNINNVTNVTNNTTSVQIGIPIGTLGGFAGFLPPPLLPPPFIGGGVIYDPVVVEAAPPVIIQRGGGVIYDPIVVETRPPVVIQPGASTGPVQVAETPPDQSEVTPVIPNAQQITEISAGPAQDAGLRGGDIILTLNNQRIRNFEELTTVLKSTQGECSLMFYSAGNNKVEQVTIRPVDGRIGASVLDVQVDVEEENAEPQPRPLPDPVVASQPTSRKTTVENNNVTALRITEVLKGPAARAGFQAGDILLGVNGQPIRNQDELNVLLNTASGEIEIAFYSPEEQRADTRRLNLTAGSLGISFELVTVATTK